MCKTDVARGRALLFLLLCCGRVSAQETHYEVTLGGEYLVTAYSFSSQHNATGMSVEASKWYRMTADTGWVALRRQPSFGLRAGLGITPRSICGHRMGVTGMVRTPLWGIFEWEAGLGVSFYSRSGAIVTDTANVYISTLATFMIDVGITARLGDGYRMSLRLLHSSNGMLHQPNRGLNYLQLGLHYALTDDPSPRYADVVSRDTLGMTQEVGFAMSTGLTTSRHSMQAGLFPCYDLSFNYALYRSPTVAYGATIDLWYNGSHTWQLPRYYDTYPVPVYLGAQAYTEGFWGPLSIKLGVGYTFFASSRVLVPMYERVGVYYNFDRSYAGIAINAHGGQAEFVELTYGHRFRVVRRR